MSQLFTPPLLANCVAQSLGFVVDARRALHQIPEIGFAEHRTSALLAEELAALGLRASTGIAGTGLTARLSFANPGPTVLLRADMDALPLHEETGLPFASRNQGAMHACGHDGHMAMVLGAARSLCLLRDSADGAKLHGNVLFLFQPAEENLGGAAPMVEAGVMDGVDFCLAAHIWPGLAEGTVGVKSGRLMASMDRFDITLKGQGGHGSQPHVCNDVVDAAAQLTCALHHVVSRRIDPLEPAVLSIGTLQAGEACNILPETAFLSGCARAFSREIRSSWAGHIRQITEGICNSAGIQYDITFLRGDVPVLNDPFVAARVRESAAAVVGEGRITEPEPTMAGEDFSRFMEHAPGCLFFLGSGRSEGAPLHSPRFTFNEDILGIGVEVFCRTIVDLLNNTHDLRS